MQQRFASALALMDQRQFDDAEAAFLSLCRETPVRSGPCTNLGILMARAGRHEAAADALTRAVEARPDNAEALNLLGVMNRRLGRMDAAEQAYKMAGVTAEDIKVAEVHDCFTPTELILMEDLGFSDRGHAWKDVIDGTFALDGDLPVNTDGGCLANGEPIGASGLRQIHENVVQLRGEGGERQVPDAHVALAHGNGGVLSSQCTVLLGDESTL